MNSSESQSYINFSAEEENSTRPYKVQLLWGHNFIPLDPSVHPHEDQWFTQELQPNGDILLRRRNLD